MKILHSADWHLGKRLGSWSRLEEQKEILREIISICDEESPDLILLTGDLYDSWNPPHEAIQLLYRTPPSHGGQWTAPPGGPGRKPRCSGTCGGPRRPWPGSAASSLWDTPGAGRSPYDSTRVCLWSFPIPV